MAQHEHAVFLNTCGLLREAQKLLVGYRGTLPQKVLGFETF